MNGNPLLGKTPGCYEPSLGARGGMHASTHGCTVFSDYIWPHTLLSGLAGAFLGDGPVTRSLIDFGYPLFEVLRMCRHGQGQVGLGREGLEQLHCEAPLVTSN